MDERDTRRETPDDVEPHGRRNNLRDERETSEAQSPGAHADLERKDVEGDVEPHGRRNG